MKFNHTTIEPVLTNRKSWLHRMCFEPTLTKVTLRVVSNVPSYCNMLDLRKTRIDLEVIVSNSSM